MTPRNPWRRNPRRELTTIAALTISIIITFAILCAGLTHAAPETPQQDGKFLFALGQAGFGYGNASQVIIAGHLVCNLLDAGGTVDQAVDTLVDTTNLDRSWSYLFATISIHSYCGKHGDAVRPHKGGDATRALGVIA